MSINLSTVIIHVFFIPKLNASGRTVDFDLWFVALRAAKFMIGLFSLDCWSHDVCVLSSGCHVFIYSAVLVNADSTLETQGTVAGCLIKFNVLPSPDVSCATDDTRAVLLTSVHTFLMLFTFRWTFHSHLMNCHTRSTLVFSVLLSERTLLYKAAAG